MYNPYDFYFKKAKEVGYKARSAFKLDEIQDKFHIFDKTTKNIVDIWCAPGSWLQYAVSQEQKNNVKWYKIIWFDIKDMTISLPGVFTYKQDVTDQEAVKKILQENGIEKIDLIQSDMAPNTTWIKDLDAMKSMVLIEETLRIYKELLKPTWKFAIKVFMWPGFEEFVKELKNHFGWKNIKIFKPKSCRKESKETYIVKI